MAKKSVFFRLMMLLGIFLQHVSMVEASEGNAPQPAPKIWKNTDPEAKYEPTNRDKRVKFKDIDSGGIVETKFGRSAEERVLEELPIILSYEPRVDYDAIKPTVVHEVYQPKSVALQPKGNRPENVEEYGRGWKGLPKNTDEIRNNKAVGPGQYASVITEDLDLLLEQERQAVLNQRLEGKRDQERIGRFYDPELGTLIWSSVAREWQWADRNGHSFTVHPGWVFDHSKWNNEKTLILTEKGRDWLRRFIESFNNLYVSGPLGQVLKVEPKYVQNSENPRGVWLFTRHWQDQYGHIWEIPDRYFDKTSHLLNEAGQKILEDLEAEMPSGFNESDEEDDIKDEEDDIKKEDDIKLLYRADAVY